METEIWQDLAILCAVDTYLERLETLFRTRQLGWCNATFEAISDGWRQAVRELRFVNKARQLTQQHRQQPLYRPGTLVAHEKLGPSCKPALNGTGIVRSTTVVRWYMLVPYAKPSTGTLLGVVLCSRSP